MTQWAKLSEGEWAKFPDDWSPDQITEAVNKIRGLKPAPGINEVGAMPVKSKDQLMKEAPADLRGTTFTQMLNKPMLPKEITGYTKSIKNPVVGGVADFAVNQVTPMNAMLGAGMGVSANIVKKAAAGAFGALAAKHAYDIVPQAMAKWDAGDKNGAVRELVTAGMDSVAAALGFRGAFKGGKPAAPAKELALADEGAVQVGEDVVIPNEPPTADRTAVVRDKFAEAGDIKDVDFQLSEEMGVPPAEITVGQVPVARTTVEAGQAKIDLAKGTPEELVHEKMHQQAEQDGTPHPPEDNNAILDKYLSRDEQIRAEAAGKSGTPYEPDPSLAQDFDAASGPYSGRSAESPILDPRAVKPMGRELPAPAIDKSIVGPKEAALTGEPLPEQLGGGAAPPRLAGKGANGKGLGPKEAAALETGDVPADLDFNPYIGKGKKPVKGTQLEAADMSTAQRFRKYLHDVINFNLVTTVATGATQARNAHMSVFVAGLNAVDSVVARGLQKVVKGAFGESGTADVVTTEGALKHLFTSYGKDKKIWDLVEQHHAEAGRLGDAYMMPDMQRFSNPIMDKAASALSVAGRVTEGWTRRASSVNYLEQIAAKKGSRTLTEIIADGDFNRVFSDADVAAAVKQGRKISMAEDFDTSTKLGRGLKEINSIQELKLISPYLRFRYNNAKMILQHSPLGVSAIFGEGWSKFKAGDPATMMRAAEAMTGTAMIFGAAMYASKVMKDQDSIAAFGEQMSIRPENPASFYMITGYLLGKVFRNDPTPYFGNPKDLKYVMESITNTSKAESASDMVQSLLTDMLTETGTKKGLSQWGKENIGRWVARFARPLTTVRDLLNSMDPEGAFERDTSLNWYDPTLANLPVVDKTLPKRYGTDYAGPVKIEHPAAQQLTGIKFEKQASFGVQEMKRLGIEPRYNVFKNEPVYNNLYRQRMMEMADAQLKTLTSSPEWKKLSPELQQIKMKRVMSRVSSAAMVQTKADMPDELKKFFSMDRETRMLESQIAAEQAIQ